MRWVIGFAGLAASLTLAAGCAEPGQVRDAAAGSVPASPPSASGSAPTRSAPADVVNGFFLCRRISLCADADGQVLATLSDDESVVDPTLDVSHGLVYFLQNDAVPTDPTGRQRILLLTTVSIDGGPETVIARADGGVLLDSPVVAADGRFLAYLKTPAPPAAMPAPAATIVVQRLGDPSPQPVSVPAELTGAPEPTAFGAAYRLIGWSPDDRRLYYFAGPSNDIHEISFDPDGAPITSRLIFHPTTPSQGCATGHSDGAVSPDGDVLFMSDCHPDGVQVFRLHGETVTVAASLPRLASGWLTGGLAVDTTGREFAFAAVKKPDTRGCPGDGGGLVRVLDGVVVEAPVPLPGC